MNFLINTGNRRNFAEFLKIWCRKFLQGNFEMKFLINTGERRSFAKFLKIGCRFSLQNTRE
ncbi:hypothetical protein U27_07060 [Candidatus Vecturithrix granuli]|uniref:Uncharacterized protein n=1 Tax=Vecturithrix granuli TaxID=1499967 RepID=A0A081C667_VECG1|nr:hypothetical protein U27_07060 [Candidatus Vecturithrix granuli]